MKNETYKLELKNGSNINVSNWNDVLVFIKNGDVQRVTVLRVRNGQPMYAIAVYVW